MKPEKTNIATCHYPHKHCKHLAFSLFKRTNFISELTFTNDLQRICENEKPAEMIGFASSALSVLDNAELSITETENSSVIHMDVDKSFLPFPSSVKASIFESFSRQNMVESETDITTSIRQFITSNYGFPTSSGTEFMYADCSLALFNKLVLCCIQEGGTLCFPAG